jgi:hypothetical protein
MEPEQDGSRRHMSVQSAKEFLATIWLELQDWGAIAFISAGRFCTALFNVFMLGIAAIIALLAVLVLMLLDNIMNPSEDSTFSLISIKTFVKRTRASISH